MEIANKDDQTVPFKAGSTSNRWWMVTINNPGDDWEASVDKLKPKFWLGQLERGSEGTLHVQAILWFEERIGLTFWRGKGCWSKPLIRKDVPKVLKYCSKTDTRVKGPIQRGTNPLPKSEVRASGIDYDADLAHIKAGKIEEVSARTQITCWPNILKIREHYTLPYSRNGVCGIWIHGKPKCGKTYLANRLMFPQGTVYRKPQSKWWCGYNGEKNVVMDDCDHAGATLFHLIKIWTDAESFVAETKGGHTNPCYDVFVITSNYFPKDIWTGDPILEEAIRRRFMFWIFYGEIGDYTVTKGTEYGVIPPNPKKDPFEDYINSFFDKS